MNKNEFILISGYIHAKVENWMVASIVGTSGEPTINNNGKSLTGFVCYIDKKIMLSTVINMRKYTWEAKNVRSIIDWLCAG